VGNTARSNKGATSIRSWVRAATVIADQGVWATIPHSQEDRETLKSKQFPFLDGRQLGFRTGFLDRRVPSRQSMK